MKKEEINFKRLDELTELGYLRKVTSPCGKLFLYNYTDHCTYEKKWDKYTLNARGTVYEVGTGKVIARAFPKFFNFGELAVSKQRNLLKQTNFDSFEKMDGSLGIVYFYDGEWRINTRGSFTSDQAIRGKEILDSKYGGHGRICRGNTYLVEIIYPENRIIVDYGNECKLTFLAAFSTESGEELNPDNIHPAHSLYLINNRAPKYTFNSIDEVIETQSKLGKMEEGFVVRFADGYRCKFKSAEYLKVARLLSEMTLLNFWKAMINGEVQAEIIEEIPEEFRDECDRLKENIELSYQKVRTEVEQDYLYAIKSIGGLYELSEDRKKLGIFIKEHGDEIKHPAAMFSKLLNNNADKYIMKAIRPSGNQIVV